jgi:hypothetical protein
MPLSQFLAIPPLYPLLSNHPRSPSFPRRGLGGGYFVFIPNATLPIIPHEKIAKSDVRILEAVIAAIV